jgi:hypothetical protein
MLSRREVLSGGVVGGLARNAASAAEQPGDREGLRQIEKAIQDLEATLTREFSAISLSFGPIGMLRRNFELFIKSNGHFPEFCDVGTGVFYDVYDWHVRNRQAITVVRQPDNRYTIQFMFTTLVLRFENEPSFIGLPYDKA